MEEEYENRQPTSCEGRPRPYDAVRYPKYIPARDHQRCCDGLSWVHGPSAASTTHHGSPYDWMRFLWDATTDADASLEEILAIYALASQSTWEPEEDPADQGDYPAARMNAAAWQVLDPVRARAWRTQGDLNGINTHLER
ncbi:MAG: hypothetical protein JXX28_13930 [Deltaproteobacteria bacterium]|nr:hypothetical protein [Deltaproteobacteria bacterium]